MERNARSPASGLFFEKSTTSTGHSSGNASFRVKNLRIKREGYAFFKCIINMFFLIPFIFLYSFCSKNLITLFHIKESTGGYGNYKLFIY